jgi:hypothetical protein
MLLFLGAAQAAAPILVVTILFAGASIWISRRMDAAYARELERGLLTRAVAVDHDEGDAEDPFSMSALLENTVWIPSKRTGSKSASSAPTLPRREGVPSARFAEPASDPIVERLGALRSGNVLQVSAALRPDLPFDALLVPQVIRLLAWNHALEWARAFLLQHGHRVAGQLTDALLDESHDFAVRRRVPFILAYSNTQRAVDGLTEALADARFEIRFRVSRALEYLQRVNPVLKLDELTILETVERELSVPQSVWANRRLLDHRDEDTSQHTFLDEVLQGKANESLEHVFSLFSLVYPRRPLKVSFRALHSTDRMLRGLAIEYLESNLPPHLFAMLRNHLEATPAPLTPGRRDRQQVLDDLMASQQTILRSLTSVDAPTDPEDKSPRIRPASKPR